MVANGAEIRGDNSPPDRRESPFDEPTRFLALSGKVSRGLDYHAPRSRRILSNYLISQFVRSVVYEGPMHEHTVVLDRITVIPLHVHFASVPEYYLSFHH
jgi:hypothetical protein